MDHGLRLRHRQHASRGNPSLVLQLGVSKLARHPANCSGCPVWRRRGSRDQRRLAHCMPVFDPVACVGSARSSDHRHRDFRSTHRAFFRKSQTAHRRQNFLSRPGAQGRCRNTRIEPLGPMERLATEVQPNPLFRARGRKSTPRGRGLLVM